MDGKTKWLSKPAAGQARLIKIARPVQKENDLPARIFTPQDLMSADGTGGSPPLIAVDGKVYDLSACPMWKKAAHMKIFKAGSDLTFEIRSAPHGLEVLEKLEQVGVLAQEQIAVAPAEDKPGFLMKLLTRRHLHPMTVHFPIATTLVAGLFMVGYIVFQARQFELFALYCLVISLVSTPVAIMAGVGSWVYNYQAIWTPIWREKVLLSGVLVAVQILALVIRTVFVGSPEMNSPAFWIYAILVLVMVPMIARLGHLGGKITFPA